MFRGGPARIGVHPGPGVEGAPTRLWEFETGGVVGGSPAVVGGVVYFGSHNGFLYAVDAEDGQERWRFETGGDVFSSPAVADGVAYFGSGDGSFYSVDMESGAQRWRFETEPRGIFNENFVSSSPAVVDDVVYFGSDNGILYALEAQSGGERWRVETGGSVTTVQRSSMESSTSVAMTTICTRWRRAAGTSVGVTTWAPT